MTAEIPLVESIREVAPAEEARYLEACAESAAQLGMPLYLVGGVIRDFLLTGELQEPDLDMVTEGDALTLAGEVSQELGGIVTMHPRFLTAEVVVEDTHLDFVTARSERYLEPASLPVVSPADLAADLARRDFSVNAMAAPLWPVREGQLIDPYEGRKDLESRQLRVLHERSFFDDPTRILRGTRIGARLDLHFAPATADLARAAIGSEAFSPLSDSRLRHELILLLDDSQLETSLRRLESLGFFKVLGRATPIRDSDWQTLEAAQKLQSEWGSAPLLGRSPRWWMVYLMSLAEDERESSRASMAQRLGLDEWLTEILVGYPRNLDQARRVLSTPMVPAHKVCSALDGLSSEELVLLAITEEGPVPKWIEHWRNNLRNLDLVIKGTDLKEAGFPANPEIGKALKATLEARLDGTITASEELAFAIRKLRQDEG